jgi:hypothetical protein
MPGKITITADDAPLNIEQPGRDYVKLEPGQTRSFYLWRGAMTLNVTELPPTSSPKPPQGDPGIVPPRAA